MNIEQAKAIPLRQIVEHLGGRFSKQGRGKDAWYFSPFRPDEKTASFKINETRNTWYDFGHSPLHISKPGGDGIDLWCEFNGLNNRSQIKEALEGLASIGVTPSRLITLAQQQKRDTTAPQPPRFKLLKLHDRISYASLKEELTRRKISLKLAHLYLKQAFLQDTENPERKINGFAFANDKGGYEISTPQPHKDASFKIAITPKYPTTIQGKDQTRISLFEGFWDFLSWLEMNKWEVPPHIVCVLNSVSFIQQAAEIVTKQGTIKHASIYFDNDEAGFQATNKLALLLENNNVEALDLCSLYWPQIDLSDYRKLIGK